MNTLSERDLLFRRVRKREWEKKSYHRDIEKSREKDRKYRSEHADQIRESRRRHRSNHLDEVRDYHIDYKATAKLEALTHYGPNGLLQCSWPCCNIVDIDMLSIDHINDDGAAHRNGNKGLNLYLLLRRENYPEGFQTLCHNHQWKKELMRKREVIKARRQGKASGLIK